MTDPAVPTGMNAGVSTSPCGVRNTPARAAFSCRVTRNEHTRITLRTYRKRRPRPTPDLDELREVFLVNTIEYDHRRLLDDSASHKRDAQKSLPPVGFGIVGCPGG